MKTLNSGITLDYLPTLRNIGLIEENADEEFELLKANSSADDDFTENSRRRSRRRQATLVRDHYLTDVVCGEKGAKEVGKILANMRLKLG